MGLSAVNGDVLAACRLILDDAPPMRMAIFYYGHLVPPRNENLSLTGTIAQKIMRRKTGPSDGYIAPYLTLGDNLSRSFNVLLSGIRNLVDI